LTLVPVPSRLVEKISPRSVVEARRATDAEGSVRPRAGVPILTFRPDVIGFSHGSDGTAT